jgi:hypothetical protein
VLFDVAPPLIGQPNRAAFVICEDHHAAARSPLGNEWPPPKPKKAAITRGLRRNYRFEISDFKKTLREIANSRSQISKNFWRNYRLKISDLKTL